MSQDPSFQGPQATPRALHQSLHLNCGQFGPVSERHPFRTPPFAPLLPSREFTHSGCALRPGGGPASTVESGGKTVSFAGQSWCFPGPDVPPPGVPADVPIPAGWTPPPRSPNWRNLGPARAREAPRPDHQMKVTGETGFGSRTGRAGCPKRYPAHPPWRQTWRANPRLDGRLEAPAG